MKPYRAMTICRVFALESSIVSKGGDDYVSPWVRGLGRGLVAEGVFVRLASPTTHPFRIPHAPDLAISEGVYHYF